ncbi:hypothetical protein FA15DRAFT_671949 [Coprinopsis marcescibilis]|uniref:Uncharacterized protein n=1 Tax=Coprinopsis marcescibilis TaxID=230819 RepID=A0A5C3KNI8_COPMA|nr:hypothetical protein FA15DRAFT_671949 [Coprinopsis marcescibilis]
MTAQRRLKLEAAGEINSIFGPAVDEKGESAKRGLQVAVVLDTKSKQLHVGR